MAGSEKEQDRSEQATPSKLREARERGQVVKSVELSGWAIMLGATLAVYLWGAQLIHGELGLAAALLSQVGHVPLSLHNAVRLFGETAIYLIGTFAFFMATVWGVGLLINFFQVGPVFSFTPLKADFNRLNPVTGFKKLFNIRIVFELIKTLLKLGAVTMVVWIFISGELASLMGLLQMGVSAQPVAVLGKAFKLSFWLLAVLAAIALIDLIFTKSEYARNMRMSRREIRDEVKRREGDPKVKAKIRELQREAASRGASLSRIPQADVVITNPTHLSVAIRYERGVMPAPVVIAKGAGELAMQMRAKARQCRIPLVEQKALARKLFQRVSIDQPILPETYAQVAQILTGLYARNAGKN